MYYKQRQNTSRMRLQAHPFHVVLASGLLVGVTLTSGAASFAQVSQGAQASEQRLHLTASGSAPAGNLPVRLNPLHESRFVLSPKHVKFPRGNSGTANVYALFCTLTGCVNDTMTRLGSNSCGTGSNAIVTIDGKHSKSGLWKVTSGSVNGKCSFAIQDVSSGRTATERVVNHSGQVLNY